MSKRKNKSKFKSRQELIEQIQKLANAFSIVEVANNMYRIDLERAYNKISELERANRAIEILQSMGLIITDDNIKSGYQQTMINREIQRRMEE